MNAFEERLRSEMQDAASDIEPRPLSTRSRGRVKLRQAGLTLAGVVVVAAAAMGTGLALNAFERPEPTPAAEGESLDPRGSGGTYPCEQPDLEGACIVTGTHEGKEWAIGATLDSNELCITNWFGTPDGSITGSGCERYGPDHLGMDTASPGGGLDLMAGEVPRDVARLVLERTSGASFELELYPAPAELGIEANFYAVFVPRDATALVGYDTAGKEILREEIDASMRGDFSDKDAKDTVVTEGELQGVQWELRAHETGPGSPCVGLSYTTGSLGTALGSCPHAKGDRPFGFQLGPFAGRTDVIVVYGWVTAPVDDLAIETRRGREQAHIADAPEGFDDDYRFFVAFPPAPGKGPVKAVFVGYDAAGNVVEETPLCPGYKLASNSTCGR